MTTRLQNLSLAALCGIGIFTIAANSAASTPPGELQEMRCRYIEDHDGTAVTIEAPTLHVLSQTAASGRFQPPIPEGVSSIMCSRTSIIPAANDDEVLWLGMPLYIAELGNPGRLGVLEINQGQYRFRFLEGAARPDEQALLDGRLGHFQDRFREIQQRQQTAR